jgi:beta-glucosidase
LTDAGAIWIMKRRDFLKGTAGMSLSALSASAALLPFQPALADSLQTASDLDRLALPQMPKGFIWGASTSSYQIEGAVAADGRRPSIWDVFAHQPGRIANGDTGDIACDHYHRYAEDVDLIAAAKLQAYRFSIAWPRVMPTGQGQVNAAGLDFYERLTDRLLAKGIQPWACLYHWDLPQDLQAQGGWTNRAMTGWFADYAQAVVKRLGDRVKHWAMFNEPSVHAIFGHAIGNHAPGLTGWDNYVAAQHHQNLAQGTALSALRTLGGDLTLGTVFSLQPVHPASDREADRAAAARFDAVWNGANLDPLFKGQYPAALSPAVDKLIQAGDLETIRQKIDFLGVNYYGRAHVLDDPNSVLSGAQFGPLPAGTPVTAMGWPIEPDGLVELLLRLKTEYGNPVTYITENGACYDDPMPETLGLVRDPQRTEFLLKHAYSAQQAVAQGCALKGYFVWSLLDNFEWAEGMRRRFGVVQVDFQTLKRTPKLSYHLLAKLAQQQA